MKKILILFAFIFSATFSFAQVTQQWAAIYNGTGNGDDYSHAMSLDASGNIYVTGSANNGSNDDYATVKYNGSGVQQWVAIYNGIGSGHDQALAMTLDTSGNVYVTGQSSNGSNFDYATVKYNSRGVQQWVAIYNGTANSDDQPTAITFDASGNVYVTGYSDNGSDYDYATVKYNNSGIQQWVAIYNGTGNSDDIATALTLDANGVYVTGRSSNGSTDDYATIKYNSSGVQQWVASYNGTGNADDNASAMTLDANGNIYITGYSSNGINYDYATVKYNSSGVQQWVTIYTGTAISHDTPTAITLDASGNVYITGYSSNVSNYNYATVKYNSSGVQQWAAIYNGTGNGFAQAFAIDVDAGGDVYVTGQAHNGINYDYATVKYNGSGMQQWVAIYNGTGNGLDRPYAISLDANGDVYVTGQSFNGIDNDYATIKYSPVAALSSTQTQSNITCNAACNGTASVIASGGAAPYTYNWSPMGGTGATATSLCQGNYTCTITDAALSMITVTITITEPAVLAATIVSSSNPSSCGGSDGAIDMMIAGGTPGYTFLWSNAATSEDLSTVAAGTYNCTVTDINGCTTQIGAILSDANAPPVTLNIASSICLNDAALTLSGTPAGGTYAGTGVTGNTFDPMVAGNGAQIITYTFTDSLGCTGSVSDTISVDPCTGIFNEISNSTFSVFPNPNNGTFTFVANSTADVLIFDAIGQLVTSFKANAGVQQQLNLETAGMYTITIVNAQGQRTSQRVIVSK
ncbi:hypothetical protein BH09BAC5_BH09BAC5_20620 [soil metagenome]